MTYLADERYVMDEVASENSTVVYEDITYEYGYDHIPASDISADNQEKIKELYNNPPDNTESTTVKVSFEVENGVVTNGNDILLEKVDSDQNVEDPKSIVTTILQKELEHILGEDVVKELSNNKWVVDGLYGNSATKAVKEFQETNNITQRFNLAEDGVLDKQTLYFLNLLMQIDPMTDTYVINRDVSNTQTTSLPAIGQKTYLLNEGTSEVERMTLSQDGLMMIANFEMSSEVLKSWGLGEYDDNGNLVGIYPHYVFKNVGTTENPIWISDGGITFGYGHYVNKNDYENSPSERALVDTYANGASILPPTTPSNGVAYKVPNSSAMSMEEVWSIFREDLAGSEDAVNDFLITHNISLEQHQFDMLVSYTHNYGNYVWTLTGEKEKVLVKYFREVGGIFTAEGVMNAFESSSNPARRIQEAEIFINGY